MIVEDCPPQYAPVQNEDGVNMTSALLQCRGKNSIRERKFYPLSGLGTAGVASKDCDGMTPSFLLNDRGYSQAVHKISHPYLGKIAP